MPSKHVELMLEAADQIRERNSFMRQGVPDFKDDGLADDLEFAALGPTLSIEDARLRLYQRCRDAGWSIARTVKYLNRVLPMPAWTNPISGA